MDTATLLVTRVGVNKYLQRYGDLVKGGSSGIRDKISSFKGLDFTNSCCYRVFREWWMKEHITGLLRLFCISVLGPE
jgi:hypothetical protein